VLSKGKHGWRVAKKETRKNKTAGLGDPLLTPYYLGEKYEAEGEGRDLGGKY